MVSIYFMAGALFVNLGFVGLYIGEITFNSKDTGALI